MSSRNTFIEIDVKKFKDNFKYMQEKAGKPLVAVLKANAYGHGIVRMAKEAEKLGAYAIAVAFLEDAEKIRNAGVTTRIIIFNYCDTKYLKYAVGKNYTITINSMDQLKAYIEKDISSVKEIEFGVNLNTGMNRQGISQEDLKEFHELIESSKVKIVDVFSHFSNAAGDVEFTKVQYNRFLDTVTELEKMKNQKFDKSISNSAAVLTSKQYSFDYVRVGMALFGLQPIIQKYDNILKPVLSLKSTVSRIRTIKTGEIVGYSGSFIAEKDLKICIVPVGYADGLMFSLGNKGKVLINGKKYGIISEVCMDQIIVEIEENTTIKIGDEVVIIGEQNGEIITAEDVAVDSGTIADDIVSKLSPEIPRIYKGE